MIQKHGFHDMNMICFGGYPDVLLFCGTVGMYMSGMDRMVLRKNRV